METSSNPVLLQQRDELLLLERACDAADPQFHAVANRRRHVAPDHHVGHREPPARLEHAKRLGEDLALVDRQIDDAVRDDHVHGAVRQRNVLDGPLEKFDVGGTCLRPVRLGQGQHLIGHVEPIGLAGRARPAAPRAARRCRRRCRGRAPSRPGCSSASAVGLPQPSDASTAVSGSVAVCSALYRLAVIGSVVTRHRRNRRNSCSSAPRPLAERRPAYAWRTFSLVSVPLIMLHQEWLMYWIEKISHSSEPPSSSRLTARW